jgi:PPOX class probable F420-dependent enzyme
VDAAEARALFATARVARLASVDAEGTPHVVPICFALDGDTIYTAVDRKPKRTTRLRRLANVAANPRVAVLADRYEDDWSALWWARADGMARIVAAGKPGHERAVALLADRYEQYREHPPTGPAILVGVSRWSGWRMTSA